VEARTDCDPARPRDALATADPGPQEALTMSPNLTVLVYELLDAHDDTMRLADELPLDESWQVHLHYLRDLQRVGREALARTQTG
jgi:hypothetical protein